MKSNLTRFFILLFLLIFFLIVLFQRQGAPLNFFDDGWKFIIGNEHQLGKALYTHIVTYYTPGIHKLYSFLLSGSNNPNLQPIYVANVFFMILYFLGFYFITTKYLVPILGLICTLLFVLFYGARLFLEPLELGLFFLSASYYFFSKNPNNFLFNFLSGFSLFLSFYFKQEIAFFGIISYLFILLSKYYKALLTDPPFLFRKVFNFILYHSITIILSCFVLLLFLFLFQLYLSDQLVDFITCIFIRPQSMMNFFALPLPEIYFKRFVLNFDEITNIILLLEYYVVFPVSAVFVISIIINLFKSEQIAPDFIILLTVFSTLHIIYYMGRSDYSKLLGITQTYFLLVPYWIYKNAKVRHSLLRSFNAVILVLSSFVIIFGRTTRTIRNEPRFFLRYFNKSELTYSFEQSMWLQKIDVDKIQIYKNLIDFDNTSPTVLILPGLPLINYLLKIPQIDKFPVYFPFVFYDHIELIRSIQPILEKKFKYIIIDTFVKDWKLFKFYPELELAIKNNYDTYKEDNNIMSLKPREENYE